MRFPVSSGGSWGCGLLRWLGATNSPSSLPLTRVTFPSLDPAAFSSRPPLSPFLRRALRLLRSPLPPLSGFSSTTPSPLIPKPSRAFLLNQTAIDVSLTAA
ncbi:hypothetical protein Droror1_Dr00010864 [Drosera rotundifolia]